MSAAHEDLTSEARDWTQNDSVPGGKSESYVESRADKDGASQIKWMN